MKTSLIIITLYLVSAYSVAAQDFTATIFNPATGRTEFVQGETKPAEKTRMQILQEINQSLRAETARMRRDYDARQQLHELEKQTRLLEQIASQR